MVSALHPAQPAARSIGTSRLRDTAVSIFPALAFSVPFLVVTLWARSVGYVSTANLQLERSADAFIDGGSGLAGIADAYPPLPTVLVAVLPGGTVSVSVLASLLMGIAIAVLANRMLQRGLGWPLAVVLLQSLLIAPVVWFGVVGDLAGLLGMAFVVLAVDGFVRFIVRGDTLGGFRTGTMLAFGFLCDPSTIVYGIALIAAGPLLVPDRREDSAALTATAAVLMFPILAASASWSYLGWRFGGGPLVSDELTGGFERALSISSIDLRHAASLLGEVAVRSPLYWVVGVILTTRSKWGGIAYFLPVPTVFVVWILGFEYAPGLAFSLLGFLALMTFPRDTDRALVGVLVTTALLQSLLALTWSPAGTELDRFLELVRA